MSNYKYLDGTPVQNGDICFYSEYDGINETFHYADGIYVIEFRDNDIFPRAKVITRDEAKSFFDYDEPKENTVPIKYGSREFIVQDFKKIGTVGVNDNMLTAEYANKTYSLK